MKAEGSKCHLNASRKRQGRSPIACILYGSWSSLYYVIDLQLNTCSEKKRSPTVRKESVVQEEPTMVVEEEPTLGGV
jgi:hypothetical protein